MQAHIGRMAAAVSQGVLADCNLAEAQELQMQAMQKVSMESGDICSGLLPADLSSQKIILTIDLHAS